MVLFLCFRKPVPFETLTSFPRRCIREILAAPSFVHLLQRGSTLSLQGTLRHLTQCLLGLFVCWNPKRGVHPSAPGAHAGCAAQSRPRYARHAKSPSGEAEETIGVTGHRHGHRSRSLMGSLGRVEIEVPRARLNTADGKTTEWKSKALRAYQRRTLVADALIAGAYLAGTNTSGSPYPCRPRRQTGRRVVWRKVKTDWDAWNVR